MKFSKHFSIEKKGDNILDESCNDISITMNQCRSVKDATRQLHAFLNNLKLGTNQPSLLCVQSNRSESHFSRDFPMFGEFPNIRINVPESASIMNVLDWANVLAKRAVQHFFNSFIYLKV